MTKETKKQLKQRLALSYKPVPVAIDRTTGQPKVGEMMARMSADILANREIPEAADKYRKMLLGMSPVESVIHEAVTDLVPGVRTNMSAGYCSHKSLIGRLMGSKASWLSK